GRCCADDRAPPASPRAIRFARGALGLELLEALARDRDEDTLRLRTQDVARVDTRLGVELAALAAHVLGGEAQLGVERRRTAVAHGQRARHSGPARERLHEAEHLVE